MEIEEQKNRESEEIRWTNRKRTLIL
jgi:hypothetical protein